MILPHNHTVCYCPLYLNISVVMIRSQ
jgi:hypothetical protein